MGFLDIIFNKFGGQQNFTNQLNSYSQQCRQQGINPEQQVQSLVTSGRMSQETFNRYAQIANLLTGRNK